MRIHAGNVLLAATLLLQSCHAALPSMSSPARAAVVSQSSHHHQRRQHQRRQEKDILTSTSSAVASPSSPMTALSNSRGGGGITSNAIITKLPSTILTIVGQTLNIGIASIVASGYLGCYIASRIVVALQHYQQGQQQQQQQQILQSSLSASIAKKFQWTIIASIGHIILNHNTLFSPSTSSLSSSLSTILFLPTLWIYSSTLNKTLGGYIGCTHVILDILSTTLGSNIVVNYISSLMDVRLPTLDSEGNMSYNVNTFDTGYKQPPQQQQEEEGTSSSLWKRRLKEDVLVRTLSSLDILTSFPKDSLMNYLMACTLLSWISSSTLLGNDSVDGGDASGSSSNGMLLLLWKVVKEQWLPWWKIGLFGISGGDSSSSIGMDAKMITVRLFALHWIIMFIKGMSALLLNVTKEHH